jgi:diguanylate cyclase (GGDEF)-like protein
MSGSGHNAPALVQLALATVGSACLLLIALVASAPAAAEEWVGQPSMSRFTPADTNANPYSFAVLPLDSGEVFVGNADGVLRYFGKRWQLIPLPGAGAARSLALGRDGRIYVGGYQHFGVLNRKPDGRYQFDSLDRLFVPEAAGAPLGEVWDTLAVDDGVWFTTNHQIFFAGYQGERLTVELPERLQTAFAVGGRLVVALSDHQVYRLQDGKLNPWLKARAGLRGLVRTGAEAFLLLDSDGLMFRVQGAELRPQATAADTQLRSGTPYVMMTLPSGDYAIGLLSGEILRLSADLSRFSAWRTGPAPVIALATDREDHLWAATEADIVRLSLSDAWSLLDRSNGLRGPVTHAAIFQGRLYVSTSVGLYGAGRDSRGALSFEVLALDRQEVNHLAVTPAGLLVAARDGIYLWRDQQLSTVIDDVLGWRLFPSQVVSGRVYAVENVGLIVLDTAGDGFGVSQRFSDPSFRFDEISEAEDGSLWIDRFLATPMHFAMSGSDHRLQDPVPVSLNLGSDPEDSAAVLNLDGTTLISTDSVLYRWDGTQFSATASHPLISIDMAPSSELRLRRCADRSVYAFTDRRLVRRDADPALPFEELQPMADGTRGIVDVQCTGSDGLAWIGTWNGMVRFDPSAARLEIEREAPRIESVRSDVEEGGVRWHPIQPGKNLTLKRFRQIRLEYASPALSASPHYQSRLLGYDRDWTDSDSEGVREFSTLAPGTYRFEARTIDAGSVAGPALSYEFTVLPDWYQTLTARLAAIVAVILVFILLLRWRSQRLERRNQELEKLVSERTEALNQRSLQLEQANKRLSELADLDGLTGVANRRKLEFELDDAWAIASAADAHLSLLLIDVDHFKQFNDTFGHALGDERLKAIAERLAGWVGPGEVLARYGGEEFVLLMPGSSINVALERADAIRRDARQAGPDGARSSISIGIAERIRHKPIDQAQLFEYADLALYRAKNAGRDRVEVYTE